MKGLIISKLPDAIINFKIDDNLEVYGNNTYMYDADGYLTQMTTPDETTIYMCNTLGALTQVTYPRAPSTPLKNFS